MGSLFGCSILYGVYLAELINDPASDNEVNVIFILIYEDAPIITISPKELYIISCSNFRRLVDCAGNIRE